MTFVAYLPWFVAVVGLLMYIIADNPPGHPNVKDIGRVMFFCGLFVGLLLWSWHVVSVGALK